MQTKKLLLHLQQSVNELLEQGRFESGHEFRPSQKEALHAYYGYLTNARFDEDAEEFHDLPIEEHLSEDERLVGFFNIATGLGKTAILSGIISGAIKAAESDGESLRMVMVVPSNQLLEQTPEDLIKFSPSLAEQIGQYGGDHKDLDKPLTVMNIDGWDELSDTDVINGTNVDFLITDEGHRGTSFRRVDRLKDKFNAQDHSVIQLAVTATAHFDQDKSVENTHKRCIYEKRISKAVRNGEGAAYIQAQPVVIRIEPDEYMQSDVFNELTPQQRALYAYSLKAQAYNETALEVYRDGIDEHTGDPLSDNQAAFFCRRTSQADKLAEMLNADPVLAKKAKALGYKGVAVAIHTNGLSPGQQREYFEAVQKRNEYMAIVGDSKFKEGFDHAPIKNIFDMDRKSLVDKEQIIGRGGRYWWNEAKGRSEGLTVFDPIIYFGSDDPDRDVQLRKNALRKATTAASILGDTCVLGPGQFQGYGLTLLGSEEEFPEHEWSHIVVQRKRKGAYQIRTFDKDGFENDYKSKDLSQGTKDKLEWGYKSPDQLEKQSYVMELVRSIRVDIGELQPRKRRKGNELFGGNPNIRYITEFGEIFLLERERAEVNAEAHREDWIEITDTMLEKLRIQTKRVGTIKGIFNAMSNPPEGLTEHIVQNVAYGIQKSALKSYIAAIFRTVHQMPDSTVEEISAADLQTIQSEKERTEVAGSLFNMMQHPPEGLTEGITQRIINGEYKETKREYVEAIIERYKSLQFLTSEDKGRISTYRKKARVLSEAVLQQLQEYGEDISLSEVRRIMNGADTVFRSEAIDSFMLLTSDKLPIEPEVKKKLLSEKERTGVAARQLIHHISPCPDDLNVNVLNRIFGNQQKARPLHIKLMFAAYASLPDKEPASIPKDAPQP